MNGAAVGAKAFLIIGAVFLLLAWVSSTAGLTPRVPAFVRLLIAALFVLAAVRVGLSIAIIAFDLSPLSFLIPISLGILAWWLRPGRSTPAEK